MSNNQTSLLCIGLDSDIDKIPKIFLASSTPQFDFNKMIIEATHDFVCAYKPNMAFYEARGDQGMRELKLTMDYLNEKYPDVFTICDGKRADIGNTNLGYVTSAFDWFGFDAATLNPYFGREALEPFLDRKDKTSIILCRTSNEGAGEIQDLSVDGKPLWQIVAQKVDSEWNYNHNCMLVVGAPYPEIMRKVRSLVPQMTFLVPGIGAQGGELEAVIKAGLNKAGSGLIINVSRSIIFASDPRAKAKEICDEINHYRNTKWGS